MYLPKEWLLQIRLWAGQIHYYSFQKCWNGLVLFTKDLTIVTFFPQDLTTCTLHVCPDIYYILYIHVYTCNYCC